MSCLLASLNTSAVRHLVPEDVDFRVVRNSKLPSTDHSMLSRQIPLIRKNVDDVENRRRRELDEKQGRELDEKRVCDVNAECWASLELLAFQYESMIQGASNSDLVVCFRIAERSLQKELSYRPSVRPEVSAASLIRDFCTTRLFRRPDSIVALFGKDQQRIPSEASLKHRLRLLNLQIQLRLACAALQGSGDPLTGTSFKETKKFLQARFLLRRHLLWA